MREVFIYALCDNSGIKYIGKSVKPKYRLTCHLFGATHKGHKEYWYRKSIWIREKLDEIHQIILEKCNDSNWIDREIYWIEFYSKTNVLVNQTKGGAGQHGYKKTPEQIQRAKDGKKIFKHTEETKIKMSKTHKSMEHGWLKDITPWNKGKEWSSQVKEKMSNA